MDIHKVQYDLEHRIKCYGRTFFIDTKCEHKGISFLIESDGEQHFSIRGAISVARRKVAGSEKRFKSQRERDLLKEKKIREDGLLLFRFSYRQTAEIGTLVEQMMVISERGYTGIIYMDPEIYWANNITNWLTSDI